MFDPIPTGSTVVTFRVRKDMERDLRKEARKRKLKLSEVIRLRLQDYADRHAEKTTATAAK